MNFEFKYESSGRQLIARRCQEGFGGTRLFLNLVAEPQAVSLGFGGFGKFGKVYLHMYFDTITFHHIQNVNDDDFH